jgi:glucokinase
METTSARPSAAGARRGTRLTADLRGLNLQRILAVAMELPGSFTRGALIEATGLSAPTVGNLTTDLIRRGLLIDLGTGPSRGGRRPSFMQFNARHGFVAGIDLGASRVRLAVADLRGDVLDQRVVTTPRESDPDALLSRVADDLQGLLGKRQVPLGRLLAVCAGAPGVVDRDQGTVTALAHNLEGWVRVPMAGILERELGATVLVENDVNLAVLGERWRGAAQGHDTCAFLTFGTGIGAGIVVNGRLHHGHHYLAGEIGLMCLGPQHLAEGQSPQGSLEMSAGLRALAERWMAGGANDVEESVGDLVEAARTGEGRARDLLHEVATLLGLATANLSLVVDPSLIVLGGSLILRADSLADEVRRIVGRIVPRPNQIVVSQLGDEAPLWGGLLVAATEARERVQRPLRQVRPRAHAAASSD